MFTTNDLLSARPIGFTARLVASLAQLARRILGFLRAIDHRGDVRTLLELDERALKDIGLTRNDVIGALAQPVGTDPSKIRYVRSVERRARYRPLDVAPRPTNAAPADCRA